ncbi:MAG TPA: CHAD domain-containing protein [Ktedonobacterales bacterium]|nr:CHAD domain-containing protein [Ktedonobacterales bacterium]
MEIEAKFAITGALDPASLTTLPLHLYTLRSTGVERHSDTLLDTPSRAVTSTRHSLRIRTIGERRIVTLKGPNSGAGGVHERAEVEAELSGPLSFDPRDWPREVGEPALALTRDEPLAPLLRDEVERQLWTVRRSGRVIGELALDTGQIIAAGRHEPIHELELELKGGGSRTDLDALCRALTEALPLAPEPRSKLQRGLALLRHARWALDGYTPLDALVRHTIRRSLRDLRRAQRLTLEMGDADAIHDMRVATRRIRSTLQAFEGAGVYRDKTLRSLRKRLSPIADALGEIRNLDIFLKRVREWVGADAQRERDSLELRDLLAAKRLAAYERLVERLKKRKHARLLRDLERFVSRSPVLSDAEHCVLTRHFVGSALWPRYERVLRFETRIAGAEPPTLHQLRITCKRLRYVLEVFAGALGEGVTPVRKALTKAQSHLGDVQDLTVALRLVTEMSQAQPENHGLAALREDMWAERAELVAHVGEVWETLRSQHVRDALSFSIAAL